MNSAKSRNLPLIAGAAIVLLLVVVATFAPSIAPKDPLARTLIAEIGGQIRGTPFPPFQSWEWPLGSDRFGRDLYSRLLYAIRPTLILVAVVALIRLSIGVLIGAIAGWSQRAGARLLNLLIDAALALPLLLVALAAITAVGIETGLIAFIIGMCLTGWAETAQTIRAQTQLVATQPYIAAAKALGATGPQIVLRHISRHIGALLATLFAFEISATLMLTGALAFMGYFIGGGVWVITDGNLIPVAERIAGMPELGQLVGTAEIRISSRPPWEMIFPGLVMALAILGFTLLGEGLRRRQMRVQPGQIGWFSRLFSAPASRIEEALLIRAGAWDNRAAGGLYGIALAVLLGAGALVWWQTRSDAPAPVVSNVQNALAAPEGWTAQRGDPYGTLRGLPAAPTSAPSVVWEFAGAAGLSAPAVGPDGTIYVAEDNGALSAYNSAGDQLWRFVTSYRSEGTSGPIVGLNGAIYYAVVDAVQAVGPDGGGLWLGRNPDLPYQEILPRISPDGGLVFFKNTAFKADDGSLQPITVVPDEPKFADGAFLVGADGRTYYRSEHRIVPWRQVDAGVAVQPPLTWSASNAIFMPADAGITVGGTAWMLYSTTFADTRLVWVGADGRQIGEVFYPLREARAVAANDDDSLQICGMGRNRRLICAAFSPISGEEPLWTLELGTSGNQLVGSAVANGRLYIVGSNGTLYSLQ